jgi:hypothetical protein
MLPMAPAAPETNTTSPGGTGATSVTATQAVRPVAPGGPWWARLAASTLPSTAVETLASRTTWSRRPQPDARARRAGLSPTRNGDLGTAEVPHRDGLARRAPDRRTTRDRAGAGRARRDASSQNAPPSCWEPQAMRATVGTPLPPAERGDVDRITERARSRLGSDTFAAHLARGAQSVPADR